MDHGRYIFELYEMQKKFTDPGEATKQLLSLFVEKQFFSTYQCYKELNKHKKVSYKNVHKKVQKLYQLGILKEVSNNGPTKHGAIYYKLSFFGIYFIFLTHEINSFNIANLIENYSNDRLFEYFLYQFIEKKTIKEIKSRFILEEVYKFLKECCSSIEYYYLKKLPKLEKYRGNIKYFIKKLPNIKKYRGSAIKVIHHLINSEISLYDEIDKSSSNLCMNILNCVQLEDELVKLDNEMIPSLELLSKDPSFKNTLQKIKNNFDKNFYKFESLSLT